MTNEPTPEPQFNALDLIDLIFHSMPLDEAVTQSEGGEGDAQGEEESEGEELEK